jgi:hypothetical protein
MNSSSSRWLNYNRGDLTEIARTVASHYEDRT